MTVHPPTPALTDGVVTLRPWRADDLDQLVAACQDPAIARFIPIPVPYTVADGRAYLERTSREWASGAKAAFAIVAADDDTRLLGAINVAIVGAAGNSGYWVAPAARGHQVARRALRLLTDWAFAELDLGVIILEIRAENPASMAVAIACDYREAGRLDVNLATGTKGGLIFSRLAGDRR